MFDFKTNIILLPCNTLSNGVKYHYSVIEQWMVKILNENLFFRPTPLYKEFMILDLIEKDSKITQRTMSHAIGVAVSSVNQYLDSYETQGLIKREYISTKDVKYIVMKKGLERVKVLNMGYLKASQTMLQSAKENIAVFLEQIHQKGFNYIILYGAGEVAEIILQVLQNNGQKPITAVAIIDDDPNKQDKFLINTPIIRLNEISQYKHDGVLISSYTNNDLIYKKLLSEKFDSKKIIRFFDN
jgi:predicted transcriptional regulator